jgi:ATP-dependent Clp protease adaptor protein ClpS
MSETVTLPAPKEKTEKKVKRQPPYNVILLNDDFHTVEYVILLCRKIFGFPDEKGLQVAKEVHEQGRCILWTGPLEVAELKQEQIHAIGRDPLVKNCQGSMTAILEPAA